MIHKSARSITSIPHSAPISKSTHTHQKAWRYICAAHFIRCLADRSISFFLPLYLSKHCHGSTLRPTAALTIVQNLSVVTFSTTVARIYSKYVKKTNGSSSAFMIGICIENVAVALLGLFMYQYVGAEDDIDSNLIMSQQCDDPLLSIFFRLALVCGAIDATLSSVLSMVISKEWVSILFTNTRQQQISKQLQRDHLAKANAFLSQIDLAVASFCPLVISRLISIWGYNYVLMVLIGQHLLGVSIIVLFIHRAITLQPILSHPISSSSSLVATTSNEKSKSFSTIFSTLPIQCKLISAAYVLLYFTILSPGAMLNSWMNSMSQHISILSEQTIAYFGSASQLCGALATIITPRLINMTKSLQQASAISQWFQTVCILYASFCFYRLDMIQMKASLVIGKSNENEQSNQLLLHLLFSIAMSRIGLWSFDLIERQVLQETIPRMYQTSVFNAEKSLSQLLSLCMMVLCYIFSDPMSFGILVTCSVTAVSSAALLVALQF